MKKTLGAVIAERRKNLGMTQLELAQKMGVTDKAVSKWERELSCPDINSLPILAETLGISLEELMQVKEADQTIETKKKCVKLSNTIFKALALAMGVAVTVLSALDALEVKEGMMLLGIGVTALAMTVIQDKEDN